MNDSPRLTHLRDYLRVVRDQRLLIVLAVILCAAAAFALAARQSAVYQAQASLFFADPSQDLELLGSTPAPDQTAQQRGAINAEIVNRPEVAIQVKKALRSPLSIPQLQSEVSGTQELRTGFVLVTARSGDPREAQRVANEFARQAAAQATKDARQRFEGAARALQPRLRRFRRAGDSVAYSLLQQRIASLQTLRDVAKPATIGRFSDVPTSPVAPRPVRNTILGVIIGLVLGLVAAFVRDSLDVRLRGSDEISEHMGLPLIGHVSADALGHAGLAAHDGAAVSGPDIETFRILRANLEFLNVDRNLRCVAVTSALPEEGKSTVAASLAAASAAAGRSTLLVECDLRRPSLSGRLGIEREPGLVDFLAGHAAPADILKPVSLVEPNGRNGDGPADAHALVCIPAGAPSPRPAELLGSERFGTFIGEVKQAYDLVILDTSPVLSVVDTLELLPLTDGVIVCVRARRTTRDQASAARAALARVPGRPTGLVVTGVRPGDEADYGYYYSYAYRSVAST